MDLREEVWRKKDFLLVREGWVRDQPDTVNPHKSMGPDGMYPRVLKELADVAKSLSIIFENHGEQERCPVTGEKPVTPILKGQEEGSGKLLVSQPRLLPWKVNGTDYSGGSSEIKATVGYKKRNGKINLFPLK